jgi:hypothetical protein
MNKLIKWINIRVDEDLHRAYQTLPREKHYWFMQRVRQFMLKLLSKWLA